MSYLVLSTCAFVGISFSITSSKQSTFNLPNKNFQTNTQFKVDRDDKAFITFNGSKRLSRIFESHHHFLELRTLNYSICIHHYISVNHTEVCILLIGTVQKQIPETKTLPLIYKSMNGKSSNFIYRVILPHLHRVILPHLHRVLSLCVR